MMAGTKKIWGILFLALSITAIAPYSAWAEETNSDPHKSTYAMSAADFAESVGGSVKEWMDVARGITIPCGETTCKTATQKCIKCTEVESYNSSDPEDTCGVTTTYEVYECIAKDQKANSRNSTKRGGVTPCISTISISCVEIDQNGVYSNSATVEGMKTISYDVYKTDAKGRKYHLAKSEEGYVIEYGNEKAATKGCEVLPVKLYNQKDCFFCPLFKVLVVAAEDMTRVSFEKLAGAFQALIILGLAIWIAVQTLTHVSSLTKQDAPKFLGNILRQSFKFLIAFLLLRYTAQIYQYAVMPILLAGMDFGNELLIGVDQAIAATESDILGAQYLKGLYPALHSYISHIQASIAFMQAIGTSLICVGGHMMVGKGTEVSWDNIADGFQMIVQGILLAIFGLLLSLAFGFYLIDAVVQLGIVGALMPFLIASWPFKITAKYAKTGCDIVLNSFFIFVFIGLVVTVNLKLVDAALQNTVSSAADGVDTSELGGLYPIYDAINTQDIEKLRDLTDITFIGFIILVVCCLFGFKLTCQSSSLAGKFSGGAISGIGASIGTMAASAALGTAKKVTAPIRDAVGGRLSNGMKSATNALIGAPGSAGKWAMNKLRGNKGGAGSGSGGGSGSGDGSGSGSGGGSGSGSGGGSGNAPTISEK